MDLQTQPSFLRLSDEDFVSKLKASSKFKDRSDKTLKYIHFHELNKRLSLQLDIPDNTAASENVEDSYASLPNLENTSKIQVVYIGNSMLERFKTTGLNTNLGRLGKQGVAWNAGCGGDKTENVAYRLGEGMYKILKNASEHTDPHCDIKLWVLASGTNNLHSKRPFRAPDVDSYRLLLEACLRIAPRSTVLACDMFYRKDIPDSVVDESNALLRKVVGEVNHEIANCEEVKEVVWIETRNAISSDLLIDHVHMTEEGYAKWDEVLWSHVCAALPELDLPKYVTEMQDQSMG